MYSHAISQVSPLVDVGFDNCALEDVGSVGVGVSMVGNISCECGLVSESMGFDGANDGLVLDKDVNFLFNRDFTMEMYFSVLNASDIVDLFSYSRSCDSDSSFSLIYLPSVKKLRFIARQNISRTVELDVDIDLDKCWHHLALIRRGFSWVLFLDGKVDEAESPWKEFVFHSDNSFSIGNSACLGLGGFNYNRFKGRIDNFKIYNVALSNVVLRNNSIKSDQILNDDITIFSGSEVAVEMGPTCAQSFNWTNTDDLDDKNSLTPTIKPKESTTYYIFFKMDGLVCQDSLSIYVKDKGALDCDKLLLPSAFTPNEDGINDVFAISNKYIVEDLKTLEIYNREGSRVFKTQDVNGYWDGSYQEKKLNPGKYVYNVSYVCGSKEYQKKGIVNLIR